MKKTGLFGFFRTFSNPLYTFLDTPYIVKNMNLKIKILVSVLVIIAIMMVGVIINNVPVRLFSNVHAVGSVDEEISDTTNSSNVNVEVIDNETEEPIENAIVYVGNGFWNFYTNSEGVCSIIDIPWGSYALSVYMKEYERFSMSCYFEIGVNNLTIRLDKKSEIPLSFSMEGVVLEIITGPGTRSENHYFVIKDSNDGEEYLFNEIGYNRGFDEFVNKTVRITGYKEYGFIGWQHEKVEGIYIESIKEI